MLEGLGAIQKCSQCGCKEAFKWKNRQADTQEPGVQCIPVGFQHPKGATPNNSANVVYCGFCMLFLEGLTLSLLFTGVE